MVNDDSTMGHVVSGAAKASGLERASNRHVCLLTPGVPLPPVSMLYVNTRSPSPFHMPRNREERRGLGSESLWLVSLQHLPAVGRPMPTQTGEGTGLGSPYTASLSAEVWVELRSCIHREEEPGLYRDTQP